jgi:hypothetical protein
MATGFAVNRVERHPSTEREALGNAALLFCRVAAEVDDVVRARFYWVGTSGVAIQVEAETDEALDIVTFARTSKLIGAAINLANAGVITGWERCVDPRDAMFNYYSRR